MPFLIECHAVSVRLRREAKRLICWNCVSPPWSFESDQLESIPQARAGTERVSITFHRRSPIVYKVLARRSWGLRFSTVGLIHSNDCSRPSILESPLLRRDMQLATKIQAARSG